ncbi:DUF6054 family protein [Alicyclobacillus ferrooxydans]|uniref:Uncharacterized protein n=1 Tax=Alicyclobacillus ferrooxydans TaxID=471514 RepID=A0A0P9F2E7_9BACL|nr:DUF6054 family protein [Alicyclobacillus ferrooxydans]KPV45539.1 hypothetical protein AN477_00900 [Alicyclobacillus ferrooxydans]
MSKLTLKVNLSPLEALAKVTEVMGVDLVHEEQHKLDGGLEIGTLIFEKYYMRVKNRIALIVIADNFQGSTEIRAIATASSEGIIFNFDWGAGDSFLRELEGILEPYVTHAEWVD